MPAAFTISKDTLGPLVMRLAGKLSGPARQGFVLAWGRGTAVAAQRNARAKGGRRFWRDVARSINVRSVGPDGIEVFSDHVAAAQKQFGGTIAAPGKSPYSKGAKALTIPISEEAEGRTAAEFALGGRKLFVLGKEAENRMGILGYSEDGEFHALFVLRKRVEQKADPFFPKDGEILELGEHLAAKKLGA